MLSRFSIPRCSRVWLIAAAVTALPTQAMPQPTQRDGALTLRDGAQLHYRVIGSGSDTVLVVHGGPSDMEYLSPDLAPLARGRTLLFYDQRALGQSSPSSDSTRWTLQQFVDDLDEVREQFGLARVSVLGHSWGGMLAAMYAAHHPSRVERLVLVAPGAPTSVLAAATSQEAARRLGEARQQSISALGQSRLSAEERCLRLRRLNLPAYWADTVRARRSHGRTCVGSTSALAVRSTIVRHLVASLGSLGGTLTGGGHARSTSHYDLRPWLRTIATPTLVIAGDNDFLLPSAKLYVSTIPGAQLHLIGDAGHFPYVEQPTSFFRAVEQFLQRP